MEFRETFFGPLSKKGVGEVVARFGFAVGGSGDFAGFGEAVVDEDGEGVLVPGTGTEGL